MTDQPVAMPTREGGERPPRPIRKDEIVIEERGLYVESWLPERRSRRRPLFLLHGELTGSWLWHRFQEYFAGRGWEAHALNLRGHYWSETDDYEQLDLLSYLADAAAAVDRLASPPVVLGHGMGGLLAMKLAEQRELAALVLLSPTLPRQLRPPARPHELHEVPDIFQADFVGWQSLPEAIRRQNPDLTIADVIRVQHLMGAESGRARRQALAGVVVDRARLTELPVLVVGAGLDRWFPADDSERLATWLGAAYEPFGAHSHFGLVAGEESHVQVADVVRAFLEAHRL
ncbi:MAG TPA: alpha/beta fold hydrolase [Candidatus Limnocylindrales bacterium]|nr:alpha/beta fold hydrolase [Candidatus Limnocylindrales bacterium]